MAASCNSITTTPFLVQHEKVLAQSSAHTAMEQYVDALRFHPHEELSLFFPEQSLLHRHVHHLKQTVQALLTHHVFSVNLKMTVTQFAQFRMLTIQELIFWHGNQFLTGASFYPSSAIPPVIYFQWGNLFGVVKTHVSANEKSLKANLLMYFEELAERSLYECIKAYSHQQAENEKHFQHQKSAIKRLENLFLLPPPVLMVEPEMLPIEEER